jgi:uncharacterized protein YdhG (YjbR/CyaY superfamily)
MSTAPKAKAGFSAQERAAMKVRAAELKAEARDAGSKDKAEAVMRAKVDEMPEPDRAMAERLSEIVTEVAPDLTPKLYYGQLGWARGGKVVVFFRSGLVDKQRYSTLGFSSQAKHDDDGGLWPTSYALERLTAESEKAVAALVRAA